MHLALIIERETSRQFGVYDGAKQIRGSWINSTWDPYPLGVSRSDVGQVCGNGVLIYLTTLLSAQLFLPRRPFSLISETARGRGHLGPASPRTAHSTGLGGLSMPICFWFLHHSLPSAAGFSPVPCQIQPFALPSWVETIPYPLKNPSSIFRLASSSQFPFLLGTGTSFVIFDNYASWINTISLLRHANDVNLVLVN